MHWPSETIETFPKNCSGHSAQLSRAVTYTNPSVAMILSLATGTRPFSSLVLNGPLSYHLAIANSIEIVILVITVSIRLLLALQLIFFALQTLRAFPFHQLGSCCLIKKILHSCWIEINCSRAPFRSTNDRLVFVSLPFAFVALRFLPLNPPLASDTFTYVAPILIYSNKQLSVTINQPIKIV